MSNLLFFSYGEFPLQISHFKHYISTGYQNWNSNPGLPAAKYIALTTTNINNACVPAEGKVACRIWGTALGYD